MEVNQKFIKEVLPLDGSKKYIIPPYQRPYKWDKENARQLVEDILDSFDAKESEYFVGSIICIKKENKEYEVVDGQQRLITLTLILLVLEDLIDKQGIKNDLKERVVTVDPYTDCNSSIPSLTVREQENIFYLESIIEGKKIPDNLKPNQKVFLNNKDEINKILSQKGQEELNGFAKHLIDKVGVVFVEVDNQVSAFRLFHVLNSRGMPLSDADLIKNTLLSSIASNKQRSKMVEDKWAKMEELVGDENLNDFLSLHQISEKTDRDRVKKKSYDYYAGHLKEKFNNNAVEMLNVLHDSAEKRYCFQDGNYGAEKIVNFLNSLLRPSEWEPAFMAFLNKGYGEDNFCKFAELFEKIYMHYFLADKTKSQREMVCYHAIEAINNNKSFDEIISCLHGLADNQLLEKALDVKLFYDPARSRIINMVKSVLLRVNAAFLDDSVSISYPDLTKITVEHILPRNIEDSYWRNNFKEEEHEEWCHKLGNLTLLSRGKNSTARNLGFDKKKEAYQKSNQKSPFEITRALCDLDEWNMEALQNRHEILKAEIKKLWNVA